MDGSQGRSETDKAMLWGVITPATPVITPLYTFASHELSSTELELQARQRALEAAARKKRFSAHELIRKYAEEKPKQFCLNVQRYFAEYAGVAQIHGVRHLAEPRSQCEKLVWLLIVVFSLCGCSIMISRVYDKYQKSPVMVSFATEDTPIHEVPFPAVTICPETKTSQTLFSYMEADAKLANGENLTEYEKIRYHYLYLICDHDRDRLLKEGNDTFSEDFFNVISLIKPKLDEWLYQCKWFGEVKRCDELFTPIVSDQGLCYTFNGLHRKHLFRDQVVPVRKHYSPHNTGNDWTGQKGYGNLTKVFTYPRRALLAGADNSLEIQLRQLKSDFDYECKSALQGFRVLLHNPMEVPRLAKYYFRVASGSSTTAAVQPKLMMTSEQLLTYSPDKRHCYLGSERPLKYFKIYSQNNCLMECLANHTLQRCGCVHFFMPRYRNNKICGIGKYKCLFEEEDILEAMELEIDLRGGDGGPCHCMPLCMELGYDVEVSASGWDWREYLHNKEDTPLNDTIMQDGTDMSMLTIYIKSEFFLSLQRNELYGVAELVSNFGGILSLFTGLSILSLVEMLYFLSVRIICNRRLYGQWAGL